MSAEFEDVYDGSQIFKFLSDSFGLPIDLVNFLVAQTIALCLARLFRKTLRSASSEFRHSVCLALGVIMGYFCFGKQAIHLLVLPMISYVIIRTVTAHIMGNLILAVSMFYLSCLHIHRQMYHTADYSLDITGPLMVITQRVTSLGYSVQDSLCGITRKTPENSTNTSITTLDKFPTPLEFFAYTLAFQTLMCGPVVFYADYISFIDGDRCDSKHETSVSNGSCAGGTEPSPRSAVMLKVAGSVTAALLYLSLTKRYSLAQLKDLNDPQSEVCNWSALYLLWYSYLCTFVVRCKYYHAWLLADAICNNSGMGFNGYDKNGQAKWDKLSNIDVLGFELAQNFRSAIASWNKNTNTWLRAVAYERGGAAFRTARVYALSAIWHGFYPGYYLTFLAGGIFTVTARKVRVVVRPLFVERRPLKLLYDIASMLTTRVAMTYATVPFVVLHLGPSLAFYGKFYYSLHFIALGALLIPSKSIKTKTVNSEKELRKEYKNKNGELRLQNGTNGTVKVS